VHPRSVKNYRAGVILLNQKGILRRVGVLVLSASLVLLTVAACAVLFGGIWALTVPDRSVREELFLIGVRDRTTRLYAYDREGEARELSSDRISGYQNALYCPLGEMPENLKNAFIAIEDKRFYDHGGIDWWRTASAVLGYLRGGEGKTAFGGSTITQQLVKNLTGDSEKSIQRKVSELCRAAELEKKLTKNDILEQYLNVVNLSENCYGVRTAANAYFSKEPSELTLTECAVIAAITNNPTKYNPIRNPQENRARRDLILSEMHAQGMIGSEQFREAVATDTVLSVNKDALSGRINSWYADLVISDVIRDLKKEHGMSEAAAGRLVYCGGLRIYTAMDESLQERVTAFYRESEHFPTHTGGKKAQSAIMIVDPKNGDILAVAGAIGEKSSNRIQNYATDVKRPSGSVIKPLSVYAPALARGIVTYATVFDDVPLQFLNSGAPWPRNSPDVYRGLVTVNTALTHSINTVSVSVLRRLGNANSFSFLSDQLHMTSLDRKNDMGTASLALGQQHEGVTLREIVGGYTALANEGIYTGTRSYHKVLDSNGELLLTNATEQARVLDEETASIMTMMLRHAVSEGTGKALTLRRSTDVAGKTGTSTGSCDKWFVGYTPELLAGVWYGHEYPESLSDVKGNPALDIFDDLMHEAVAVRGEREKHFRTPDGVVAVRFCKDSGKLLSEACHHDPRGDRSEIGYFKKGTEPTESCGCHVLIDYCAAGGVATEHCPTEGRHSIALLRVTRRFPRQIRVLDAPYSYGGICRINGRILSFNEPYYAEAGETKRYYGIGLDVTPYNRACPVHGEDAFWEKRLNIA